MKRHPNVLVIDDDPVSSMSLTAILEEAGYIACTKYFDGRLPKTEYKLTDEGRRALQSYLNHMESLIKQMRST